MTGRILVDGSFEGSGFAVDPQTAITASHVVRGRDERSLTYVSATGESSSVERVRADPAIDAAVLELATPVSDVLAVRRPVHDEPWSSDARPLDSDPALHGTVTELHRRFRNKSGETEGLQLWVREDLGGFAGYSGSPVVGNDGAAIGLLVEQVFERAAAIDEIPRASNVLYATRLDDVVERLAIDVPLGAAPKRSWTPELPEHQVRRDLKQLTDDVIAGGVMAITGMGGVGKSVIAAAVARDPDVQVAFPDVVWIRLDARPLVTHQAQLARAMTDAPVEFVDVSQGRDHLARSLASARCLLVLDDVHEREQLDAFNVIGPHCAMLFTTRNQGLAAAVTARAHEVNILKENDARTLLATWVALPASDLPPQADTIIKECGGLPLALAMSGALLRTGHRSWEWLLRRLRDARLDRVAAALPGYEHASVRAALDVSIDELEDADLPDARERYVELAVFAGRSRIPLSAMGALWGISADDTEDYAALFADRSVAAREDDDVVLHDLLLDVVAERAEPRLPALHQALCDGYAARCPAGWASGPVDGYFFERIRHHLRAAGRDDEAEGLLRSFAWIRAKLAAVGVAGLAADYDDGDRLGAALGLSATALARDPGALSGQLLGRLEGSDGPAIAALVRESDEGAVRPWLRPLAATLTRPGGPVRLIHRIAPSLTGARRIGHGSVAASADDRVAVSADWWSDQEGGHTLEALAWELGRNRAPRRLDAGDAGSLIAVSADGRVAAFTSGPGMVRVLDVRTGELVAEKRVQLNPKVIAIASEPLRIVVGNNIGFISCWDPATDTITEHRTSDSAAPIRGLVVTDSGRRAIILDQDGHLISTGLPAFDCVIELGCEPRATVMAASSDGAFAVTGGEEDTWIRLWNASNVEEPHGLRELDGGIASIAVAGDDMACIALWDGRIVVISLKTGDVVSETDPGSVAALAASPAAHIALARVDDRLLELDVRARSSASDVEATCATVTRDGAAAFAGTKHGLLYRYTLDATGVNAQAVARCEGVSRRLRFDGAWTGEVPVMDVTKTPPAEFPWPWHERMVAVATSSRGEWVAWTTSDLRLTIWQDRTAPPTSVSWRGGMGMGAVAISADDAVVASRDGTICVGDRHGDAYDKWPAPDDREDRVLAAAACDASHRLLGTRHGRLVYEPRVGLSLRVQAHSGPVQALAMVDGTLAVSGAVDGTLAAWPVGQDPVRVRAHSDAVVAVAAAPTGNFAMSASEGGEVVLWSLPDLRRLATFYCDAKPRSLSLAEDAHVVSIVDKTGAVHLLAFEAGVI